MDRGEILFEEKRWIYLLRKLILLILIIFLICIVLIILLVEGFITDRGFEAVVAFFVGVTSIILLLTSIWLRASKVRIYTNGLTSDTKPFSKLFQRDYFIPFIDISFFKFTGPNLIYLTIIQKNGVKSTISAKNIGPKAYNKVSKIVRSTSNRLDISIEEVPK